MFILLTFNSQEKKLHLKTVKGGEAVLVKGSWVECGIFVVAFNELLAEIDREFQEWK